MQGVDGAIVARLRAAASSVGEIGEHGHKGCIHATDPQTQTEVRQGEGSHGGGDGDVAATEAGEDEGAQSCAPRFDLKKT